MEKAIFISEGHQLSGILFQAARSSPRAVVFCHGAFEFKENWLSYAGRLAAEGFATLAFDFTGHGESEGLRSLVDMRIWAYNVRDAMNFLGAQGYRRFGLVGWGSGGSAVVLAAAHDRRVRCAVTISTPVFLMPPFGERIAFGLATLVSRVKKAIWKKPLTFSRLKEFEDAPFFNDAEANARYLSDPRVRGHLETVPLPESLDSVWMDISRAVQKVKIPVLILHGDEDAVVSVKQSAKLHDLIQGHKQLHVVEGAGHALHLGQRSDEVYGWIAKWSRAYLD